MIGDYHVVKAWQNCGKTVAKLWQTRNGKAKVAHFKRRLAVIIFAI